MNKNLWFLAAAQGLFLTHNVVFIAINGLVGLALAPLGWMATLPITGYVVGAALSTGIVAKTQRRFGRQVSFQLGLLVALVSALLCALATIQSNFWMLVCATVLAGYYSANGQLYRFAAAELAAPESREQAVSLVLAGGLIGAVVGPNLAAMTRSLTATAFTGSYLSLVAVAALSMAIMAVVRFPEIASAHKRGDTGRPMGVIMRQPVFIVAAAGAALGYGVMNLLMAATPLAMRVCGMGFDNIALVLEWHVIGMFAPGFFTGHLIKRFGVLPVMGVGVLLNAACIAIALNGQDLMHFTAALFVLGVGWNFLFTGSTTLSLQAYRPEEKDKAQASINFLTFITMALGSFASGALLTTQGWTWLNWGSLVPVALTGLGLWWLAIKGLTNNKPHTPHK
ncbi:MAG: MFS transporter [Burkholderiaceae bacterium]